MINTGSDLRQTLPEIASKVWQSPDGFAGLPLFPLFYTGIWAGQYYLMDDASAVAPPPVLARAPGTAFSRSVTKLGNDNYNCQPYGHEEPIGLEEIQRYATPGAAQRAATRRATLITLLAHELRACAMATSDTVPSAEPAQNWANNGGDPIGDITAARTAVFGACGLEANVISLPRSVYEALKQHAAIKAMIKISDSDPRWPQLLAALFDVERVAVARALVNNANEGQAINVGEIWDQSVIVAHVDNSEDFTAPSFGRTFIVADEKQPLGITVDTYGEDPIKARIVRVTQNTSEKLSGPKCGFHLKNVLG